MAASTWRGIQPPQWHQGLAGGALEHSMDRRSVSSVVHLPDQRLRQGINACLAGELPVLSLTACLGENSDGSQAALLRTTIMRDAVGAIGRTATRFLRHEITLRPSSEPSDLLLSSIADLEDQMSVKASVSITERQDVFARRLVSEGHYSSLSAVVQRGLELVRSETEREKAEIAALRAFFEDRAQGPFLSGEEGRLQTERMIDRKRRSLGL